MTNPNELLIDQLIEIEQPLGKFLVAKVKASDLLKISYRDERTFNKDLSDYFGTQRGLKQQKINSIKKFLNTRDATFPNTIIGALSNSELYDYDSKNKILKVKISNVAEEKAFQVIDGQHRLWAFEKEDLASDFELIVTLFLDADVEDQAYIFSIINTTQSRLDPSLATDLTELSKITTPENSVHSIAKKFNTKEGGPWVKSIKMIGKKDLASQNGIISQYSFNKSILNYVYDKKESSNIRNILIDNDNNRTKLKKINIDEKKYIFWKYYINSDELSLYIILNTYFNAVKNKFNNEWLNPNYILCKTSGYAAIMSLFKDIYTLASNYEDLKNIDFYKTILDRDLKLEPIDFSNAKYPAGKTGEKGLYDELHRRYLE